MGKGSRIRVINRPAGCALCWERAMRENNSEYKHFRLIYAVNEVSNIRYAGTV